MPKKTRQSMQFMQEVFKRKTRDTAFADVVNSSYCQLVKQIV